MLLQILVFLFGVQCRSYKSTYAGEGNAHRCSRDQEIVVETLSRREFCHGIRTTTVIVGSALVAEGSFIAPALAVWPFDLHKERRQLEVCIVSLLRLSYWAQSTARELSATAPYQRNTKQPEQQYDELINRRKQAYLEARLGAKALITGKVGGGASYRVYTLSKLELRDCLDDLEYWYQATTGRALTSHAKNPLSSLTKDLVESLASIVEFDGLETTQDPSPRSSLMLTMYNTDKCNYVQRMLTERAIPIAEELINYFGVESRRISESFVLKYYPTELISDQPGTGG